MNEVGWCKFPFLIYLQNFYFDSGKKGIKEAALVRRKWRIRARKGKRKEKKKRKEHWNHA